MAEGLNLQPGIHLPADLGDLLQAAFPGQHHPGCTQVKPGLGAFIVGNGLLGGDVALAVGGIFARQGKGTQIGHNQCIHTGVIQLLQIFRQVDDFVISRHGVHGDVALDTVVMGKLHRLGQLLRGEVSGKGTHAEAGSGQIDRIGAIEHGHFQPFHVTGGTQ